MCRPTVHKQQVHIGNFEFTSTSWCTNRMDSKTFVILALATVLHLPLLCSGQALQSGDRCPDGGPAIVCITTPCNPCPNSPPGDPVCPFEPFQCLVFPCEPRLAVCKAFPKATCRADCGCGKDFVDEEGFIVDCDGRDVCSLPRARGSCPGQLKKAYFNSQTRKCEIFTYSGCNGNANRFDSIQACEKKCSKIPGDICMLPKVVGPCEALIPSWFFNSATQKCERFNYGGCEGNANRFGTEEECKKRCGGTPTCFLPEDVGPCDGAFQRYYFNAKTRSCKIFSFGGCGGNSNNFKTLAECESACGTARSCSPKGGICGFKGMACCHGQKCCKKLDGPFSIGTCGVC